jgi:hypothetical protein
MERKQETEFKTNSKTNMPVSSVGTLISKHAYM